MPQPFQYVAPVSDDMSGAATAGLNLGVGIAQKNFAQQQQQLQVQRQQQMRADLGALAGHGAPTANDYATLVLKYPELKDSFKQGWDMLSSEQQRQRVANAGPIVNAMNNGRMDLATDMLQSNVDALRNSNGSPEDIRAAEMWLRSAKEAPDALKFKGNMFLASVMGNDFAKTFGDMSTATNANAAAPGARALTAAQTSQANATAAKTSAEAGQVTANADMERKNIQSQIDNRTGQLGLNRDTLISETQVKLQQIEQQYGPSQQTDTRALVNTAATNAVIASNSAAQMRDLATQFDTADPRAFAGNVGERMASLTGQENYITQLRKEYTRIRTSEMLRSLPPGPASDKDIENAKSGFINDTGNPQQVASWLRGMAKLQDYQSQFEDAKAQWAISNNGLLTPARSDLNINGVSVPKGTSFSDYAKQAMKYPGAAASREAQPKPAAKTGYLEKYGPPGATPAAPATVPGVSPTSGVPY